MGAGLHPEAFGDAGCPQGEPQRDLQCVVVALPGIAQVIECGPGKVLTGLNRRIERRPDLAFLALEDPASIDTALSVTSGADDA